MVISIVFVVVYGVITVVVDGALLLFVVVVVVNVAVIFIQTQAEIEISLARGRGPRTRDIKPRSFNSAIGSGVELGTRLPCCKLSSSLRILATDSPNRALLLMLL